MRVTVIAFAVALIGATLDAQDIWTPPRFEAGAVPAVPIMTVTGGEVFLEVTVTETGAVSEIAPLRTTPGFTEAAISAVRRWRFRPAEQTRQQISGVPPTLVTERVKGRVQSKVFVAVIFGSPSTLSIGELPTDVSTPTPETAYPLHSVTPAFPPLALFGGTVLAEAIVDVGGRVVGAEVIQPAAGFDAAVLGAAREWTFRPARVGGRSQQTYAYLVFAFRQPLGPGPVAGPLPTPR